ncbi:MAG: hypothetical protein AAGA18_13005, partial [Verrucomicrobiota bacterium]
GTLNHTLLTVESIRQAQLDIIGIIMNFHNCPKDLATQTNPAILEQITQLPILRIESHQRLVELPKWLLL